jgi:hypothetical protein
VSLPFPVGLAIPASQSCPPGTTPEEGALMLLMDDAAASTDNAESTTQP